METKVLILVVMDNGLVHNKEIKVDCKFISLNPCCNGQWSRTGKDGNIRHSAMRS